MGKLVDLNFKKISLREINNYLQNINYKNNKRNFVIKNPDGEHAVCAGLKEDISVNIKGHVGYYCGGMNQKANITIDGNAGTGVGENMMSGSIHVKGNVSQSAGATAHGGTIIVDGDASSRCGISMKGVSIIVKGSVGHMSAFMAQSGTLLICGNAGDALADNLRFHHWGNSSGDYWDIGVNHGLDGSGNNVKPSNTLKAAAIRFNAKNGAVTLITSPASTSTQYEGLTQNENGYVTIPHQPCFQAVRTSGSTVSSGTYITFNAEDRDVGNHYNHTNGTFTAPIAGNYFFYIASIGHNNTSTVLRLYLRINNGNIGSGNDAHLRLDVQNGAAYASNASFTYIRYMNANDTARVYFSADNGSSTLYSGADYLKFGGYLIG